MNLDSHKLHYHLDRVLPYLQGDKIKTFPIYVEISPVGYCNHRCTFCALDYVGYKDTRISGAVMAGLLSEFGRLGIRGVMFAGEGEPLLYPHITEAITTAKVSGIDVSMTTNGIPFSKRSMYKCVEEMSWIKFSVDGYEKDYVKTHGCQHEDWEKVWFNIHECVKYKKLWGSGVTIGIQSLLLEENYKNIHALCAKAYLAGVDYVVVKPYSQHGMSENVKEIAYGPILDYVKKATRDINRHDFRVIVREESIKACVKEDRVYRRCLSVPYFWAYVASNGDVYGCSAYLGDSRFCYGNINEETFEDIWLGRKRQKAIEFMETFPVDGCRVNCRMDKINDWLWDIKNPHSHKNFI